MNVGLFIEVLASSATVFACSVFNFRINSFRISYMNDMRSFSQHNPHSKNFQLLTDIDKYIWCEHCKHCEQYTYYICLHSGFHPSCRILAIPSNPANLCENRFCITFARIDTLKCHIRYVRPEWRKQIQMNEQNRFIMVYGNGHFPLLSLWIK